MRKMADSAQIRQIMPTVPRSGSTQGWSAGSGVNGIVLIGALSFVVPVGIFRVLDVPQRTPAVNDRRCRKVIDRRRRSGGPLQRPGIPGIVPGLFSLVVGVDEVVDEDQDCNRLEDCADAD